MMECGKMESNTNEMNEKGLRLGLLKINNKRSKLYGNTTKDK